MIDCKVWYFVNESENKLCHDVLTKRIENGEDPYEIMRLERGRDNYYAEKLIAGLCPFSAVMFSRIVGEPPNSRVMKLDDGSIVEYIIKTHKDSLKKE